MALVIEFGSKGLPTSFGRLLRSTQTPSAVETKCFPQSIPKFFRRRLERNKAACRMRSTLAA